MAVRNPLVALFVTLIETAIFAPALCLPTLLLPRYDLDLSFDLALYWRIGAFAVAGAMAGRAGTFAFAAFVATFLGAFVGYVAFFGLAAAYGNPMFTVIHGLVASVGGWASATWNVSRLSDKGQLDPANKRRCGTCGIRVGLWARKCWSCRASLARYT